MKIFIIILSLFSITIFAEDKAPSAPQSSGGSGGGSFFNQEFGFYFSGGLGIGGGKKENHYPFTDEGLGGTVYAGVAIPFFPTFSANLRSDKVWFGDTVADMTTNSFNLRVRTSRMLAFDGGYAWGSFWHRSGEESSWFECSGVYHDRDKHKGETQGWHVGATFLPLSYLFFLGFDANYYWLKTTKETVESYKDGVETVYNPSTGNIVQMWTVNFIVGFQFGYYRQLR